MAESARNTVRSVAKTFAVLHAFGAGVPKLTITGAAKRAGLDRGTVFRLITTLTGLGYVAPVPGMRRSRLTLKCLDLGYAAPAGGGLRALAAPSPRERVPAHADAASLGVLEGADVVYVERAQAEMGRRDLDRRAGSGTGAYAAALGHAILARQPPGRARAILAAGERVRPSERTLVDLEELAERRRAVRAAGYAVSDGENAYGLRAVAASVMGPDGLLLAGVGLTVRRERAPLDAFVRDALPPLPRAAEALTRAARQTTAAA